MRLAAAAPEMQSLTNLKAVEKYSGCPDSGYRIAAVALNSSVCQEAGVYNRVE
jgi:hypothetical protein